MSESFDNAQAQVKTLSTTPSNDELLQLYALYKQGTVGDVVGKRPGMLDMKGRAKYDAWSKTKGIGETDAQEKYVALVNSLVAKNG